MGSAMNCSYPECSAQGPIVVKYAPVEIRSCDEHWPALYRHYLIGKKRSNVNLGQTLDKWTHIDKKTGNEIRHRLSVGKDWEVSNRTLAEDGKTAINRVTKKPAQY